jgi:hypothetical protein
LPGLRLLPDADALFVHLSVFLVRLTSEEAARCNRTVLVRSNNRVPSGQLRFIQGRNYLGLLHLARNGFLSFLAAAVPASRSRRRANAARGTGELCLRCFNLAVGLLEGLSQPAWPNLSPVTWDYP